MAEVWNKPKRGVRRRRGTGALRPREAAKPKAGLVVDQRTLGQTGETKPGKTVAERAKYTKEPNFSSFCQFHPQIN